MDRTGIRHGGALRINKLLRADSAVTVDDMRRFQTDPGSARADAFVPLFLSAAAHEDSIGKGTPALREGARLLAEWNRQYTRENRRAVLFEAAMTALTPRLWDELAEKGKNSDGTPQVDFPEAQMALDLARTPDNIWWDNRHTPVREDRDMILAASLEAGYAKAKADHGSPDSNGWLWSNIQHARIGHLLGIPALSVRDIPVQGGPSTLSPSSGSGGQGPSWRMVVELGREIRAWSIYPGGQSGAPASERYTDRLSRWESGKLDEGAVSARGKGYRSQARHLHADTGSEMNMTRVVKVILLAEAFAVTTFGLGWWTVPIVAAIWAAFSSGQHRARVAGLCAVGGWATLLLLDAVRGPVGTMATKLGGVMGIPSVALWLVTLSFAALLAWSAATITPSLRGSSQQASS